MCIRGLPNTEILLLTNPARGSVYTNSLEATLVSLSIFYSPLSDVLGEILLSLPYILHGRNVGRYVQEHRLHRIVRHFEVYGRAYKSLPGISVAASAY